MTRGPALAGVTRPTAVVMEHRREVAAVAIMLVIITVLHYAVPVSYFTFHNVFRTLYFVPIIYAAFRLGIYGGTIAALSATILYVPHVLLYFGALPVESTNDLQEVALFNIVGVLTGWLVEAERRQANRVGAVADELELSYGKLQQHVDAVEAMRSFIGNILDSLGCGVITLDLHNRVTTCNPAARAILGLDPVGKSFIEVAKHRIPGSIELAVGSSSTRSVMTEIDNSDHTPVAISFSPLRTREQAVIGSVVIIEDFTEVKSLERQVRQTEKLSSLGNLAGSLAHEIRNPVGIIRAAAQMLDSDLVDDNLRECTSVIRQESDRIERLVQELLQYARPRPPMRQNVDSVGLVKNVASVVHAYAAQQEVEVRVETPAAVSPLWGDEEQLHQCLFNLVLNAIQAMPSGGRVTLTLREVVCAPSVGEKLQPGRSSKMEIAVMDEGPGITRDEQDRIFEPFFSTKANGTGLGLAIVQRVVEQHGGSVRLESKPGRGSVFTVSLPVCDNLETGRPAKASTPSDPVHD
ncbi:MAG: ATP-binding protein [Dehalococcoidia bacterium]|nr:ATP-binding protein [Dehalococcoidia bacterium]